jgi:hypothetical protein
MLFSANTFAIDLIINGKRFYIREYQISPDGQEIKINHEIDLPTECANPNIAKRTKTVTRTNSHRNPKRRISIFERVLNGINRVPSSVTQKKNHQ